MKKANIKLIMFLIVLIFQFNVYGDEIVENKNQQSSLSNKEEKFKIIGYYSGDLFDEPLEKLQIDKLTHVIYAFLIPQADGTLIDIEKPEQLKDLVKKAHEENVEVFIALGGWSYEGKPLQPIFEEVSSLDETRHTLVKNVCKFVNEYNLDGVEIDWEHPNKNSISSYEQLVLDLKESLEKDNKKLTAALNGAWSNTGAPEPSLVLTDKCLEQFDFINVMSYDMNNEDHSPIWFAETSINYWLNRGVKKEDIVLGMPLYAKPSFLQYRHLVELNKEYAYIDFVETSPLPSYYNSINTLREKTIIALNQAGGVMLFDVNEDTNDETSIVTMIYELSRKFRNMSEKELQNFVSIIVDKKEIVFVEKEGYGVPYIDENNRTMVPFRKIAELIGVDVSYDMEKSIVYANKDNVKIEIYIGTDKMKVNGNEVKIDTKAVLKNNRTYIPIKYCLENFGYKTTWHQNSKTAIFDK